MNGCNYLLNSMYGKSETDVFMQYFFLSRWHLTILAREVLLLELQEKNVSSEWHGCYIHAASYLNMCQD